MTFSKFSLAIAAMALCLTSASGIAAAAASMKTFHAFCTDNRDCPDGEQPIAMLLKGADGALYGTTSQGGRGGGVVFELVPNGNRYDYRVIHKFCSKRGPPHCKDGYGPGSGVIEDVNGNLYGTAFGGNGGYGLVYELVPNADRSKFSIVTLYSFCPNNDLCPDGEYPNGLTYQGQQNGVPYDGTSPLFGTTQEGGTIGGVAYQLNYVSGQTLRSEKVIYSFCSKSGCADGQTPSDVSIDSAGNLFGTTRNGGTVGQQDAGIVFELSPSNGAFSETVLYNFCSVANCADGATPMGGVVPDGSGKLVGTTTYGGSTGNYGVVFRVDPNNHNSPETVLHDFCSQANCADGEQPLSGVSLDSTGNIFGSTHFGGTGNFGVLFELTTAGYAVLHTFCTETCRDGGWPIGALTLGQSELFGTTTAGGRHSRGTVFRLKL